MSPKVKKVTANKDYTLTLLFDDGKKKKFNARPYLNKGIFKKLKDWNSFRRVRVGLGTVIWPGELDIAPETLYVQGVTL